MQIILLIIFTGYTLASYGGKVNAKTQTISTKKIVVPPGTVQISANYFFDATEISNFSWLEYMAWNKKEFGEKSVEYKQSLPDTTVWMSHGAPYVKHYLRHPSYHNYPVVGITHAQATTYCQWRSDRVNEFYFAKNHKEEYETYQRGGSSIEIPEIFNYRLPTDAEWEAVAGLPFSKKAIRKMKNESPYNLKGKPSTAGIDQDDSDTSAPVDSYWPNEKGIYHLVGNVAEMIAEEGLVKGGSFCQTVQETNVEGAINYDKPMHWIGFRCVCERAH